MKKIIKLNLNDIENIVKNTINEMESEEPTDLDDVLGDVLGDEYYVGDDTDLKPQPLLIGRNADTGEFTVIDTRTNKVLHKEKI